MTKSDPILLFVASQLVPMSLAIYMENARLRLDENIVRSVVHVAKLP